MNVIQVAVIGVIGALLALQLKGGKTEYGIYMSVAAGIFLFACIIDRLEIFIRTVEQIGSYINLDAGYLGTMLKMVGITYIAEFSSGMTGLKAGPYPKVSGQEPRCWTKALWKGSPGRPYPGLTTCLLP